MTRTPRRTRKRRREMQESKLALEIPVELVIEIMTRLPAKSVMRFKCISKFWSCFLGSTYFCNRFLMSPSPPQPRLYLSLLDHRYYAKSLLLSSVPTTCSTSSIVLDENLTVRQMGGFNLRVVRGFIGLTVEKKALIYNPTTRQLVILPAVKSNIITEEDVYDVRYFICYEPVNDQYKLLCTIAVISDDMKMVRSEFWLFLFEAGGSWKRIAKDFPPHLPGILDLTMNGVLYYLAWTDLQTCMLVSFDIRSEELSMIQVPSEAGGVLPRRDKWITHIDYGGKVAVFDYTFLKQKGTVDLWVVEDWNNKEWSSKTLVLQPSQRHLITDQRLKPKGKALKGKIILVPMRLTSPFYYLCYDFLINDLRKVEIKGIPDRWFNMPKSTRYFEMDFMDSSEIIKYLET